MNEREHRYQDLRKIFHQSSKAEADAVYKQRFESKDAVRLPFEIQSQPAFYVMDSEIYRLLLEAERLNGSIERLQNQLPQIAIEQYLIRSLIDEIVLTNEIEGVRSTRQEIGDVLDQLSKNDKRGRFWGIVEKYDALASGSRIPLRSCEDIRVLYDELVLDEVVAENPENAPDGMLFRKNATHIVNESGVSVHDGIEPESKIIELMERALETLDNRSIEPLVRISLFHFLFSFIHPFYDGNGRTNRFISSYALSKTFGPLPGLRLSHAIKENVKGYYKAFSICEHPLNKADLTPFVIAFTQIVVRAMRSMNESLKEKAEKLETYSELGEKALSRQEADAKTKDIAFILIQASLFSEEGVPASEIASIASVSLPTAYSKLKALGELNLVRKSKRGRSSFLSLDLDNLETLCDR